MDTTLKIYIIAYVIGVVLLISIPAIIHLIKVILKRKDYY
jgi:hypothetical protein